MATLLQLDSSSGTVLVDITPGGAIQGATGAEAVLKKAEATFDHALQTAKSVAMAFKKAMEGTGPQQIELELGFQFTGKGSLYLVQSEAQAAIKMKFVFNQP